MATKNDPGQFDCYQNAAPDEPLFVLLARDIVAPMLVEEWAHRRELLVLAGIKPDTPQERAQIEEARACARTMREWRCARAARRAAAERAIATPPGEAPTTRSPTTKRATALNERWPRMTCSQEHTGNRLDSGATRPTSASSASGARGVGPAPPGGAASADRPSESGAPDRVLARVSEDGLGVEIARYAGADLIELRPLGPAQAMHFAAQLGDAAAAALRNRARLGLCAAERAP